jgi:hypothetical protein
MRSLFGHVLGAQLLIGEGTEAFDMKVVGAGFRLGDDD